MARKKKKELRISDHIRAILEEQATVELLEQVAPELLASTAKKDFPTLSRLLADKIVIAAIDKKKSNEWAVQMVVERLEGKAVQGEKINDTDDAVEEQLTRAGTEHINHIAAQLNITADSDEPGAAEGVPDRLSAAKDLDLPADGDHRAEGDDGKPDVAARAEE